MIIFKTARTSADLDQVYQLRFRVLCLERRTEPEERYPSRRQIDTFDSHAFHAVGCHYDLSAVGTARVIPLSPRGLPLELSCSLAEPVGAYTAELSGVILSRYGILLSGADERSVVVGLLKVLCRESRIRGIKFWYFMAGQSTVHIFSTYGINLHPVPCSDTRRPETPHLIDLSQLEFLFLRDKRAPFREMRASLRIPSLALSRPSLHH